MYKDTLHLFTYQIGTGGMFLAGLVNNWLLDIIDPMDFDQMGHSHCNVNWRDNWNNNNFPVKFTKEDSVYNKKMYPLDETKPLVYIYHEPPGFDKLEQMYSKIYHFNITYTDEDIYHMASNWFFKVLYVQSVFHKHETHTNAVWAHGWWKYMKSVNGFEDRDTPADLTSSEVKRCIDNWMKDPTSLYEDPKFYVNGIHFTTDTTNIRPDTHSLSIPFKKLLTDKDKVLHLISDIIKKPITNDVVNNYDNYIKAQQRLIRQHIPWINHNNFTYNPKWI